MKNKANYFDMMLDDINDLIFDSQSINCLIIIHDKFENDMAENMDFSKGIYEDSLKCI